jgi:hypothetical protein
MSFFSCIGWLLTAKCTLSPGESSWHSVKWRQKQLFSASSQPKFTFRFFPGVMYYFYSVWQMFYMFSRQLGPLVRIIVMMFKQDMPKWIVMMLPFFVKKSIFFN